MQILVATTNKGKVSELKEMLAPLKVEVLGLDEVDSVQGMEVEEDGETFKDNAIKKAMEYGEKAKLFTIADDSGLIVDVLDGRPGVHSKRYGTTDQERIGKLLEEMKEVEDKERTARFVAVVALYDPGDQRVYTSTGSVEGLITTEPQGEEGFGYDPIFYARELKKVFGEATSEEKNLVSHRGKALREMWPVLVQLLK